MKLFKSVRTVKIFIMNLPRCPSFTVLQITQCFGSASEYSVAHAEGAWYHTVFLKHESFFDFLFS